MIKPKAVIWDVDDVLTPLSLTFHDSVVKTHGRCLHPDKWTEYKWGKHIGLHEGLPTQQYLIDNFILENAIPYNYTKEALVTIENAGIKNVLLSARQWHPNPHDATHYWAQGHDLAHHITEMCFVKVEESKRDRLHDLCMRYDVCGFVDDNIQHLETAPDEISSRYLMRRSWNAHVSPDVPLIFVNTALEAAQLIVQSQSRI